MDTFQIYLGERTVTTLETLTGESRVRGEDEELYARLADYLWSQAVTGSDARETILAAIRALPEG